METVDTDEPQKSSFYFMSDAMLAKGPWIGSQKWRHLLFAHYPADSKKLRELIPHEFELDRFDGEAWVGFVPFVMQGIRFRGLPAVPYVSSFLELNLRTYVKYRGQAGVYFFSLDANRSLAVWAARTFFHLPYFNASMQMQSAQSAEDGFRYVSKRTDRRGNRYNIRGDFDCSYRGLEMADTCNGDLVDWLTERYCFFTRTHDRRILRGDIDHVKWPLQSCEAEFRVNTLAASLGVTVRDAPPLLHYSEHLDVRVWPLRQF